LRSSAGNGDCVRLTYTYTLLLGRSFECERKSDLVILLELLENSLQNNITNLMDPVTFMFLQNS